MKWGSQSNVLPEHRGPIGRGGQSPGKTCKGQGI